MNEQLRRWFQGEDVWWRRPVIAWVQSVVAYVVVYAVCFYTLGPADGQFVGDLAGSLAVMLVVFRQIRLFVREELER